MPLPDRVRDNLRCKVKARAWSLLALFGKRLDRPLTVRAGDKSHTVLITVAPADDSPSAAPEQFPGNYFSPLEASIYLALASGPLLGKVIARRTSQDYNTCLRTILSNLVQRKVLVHSDEGYARGESKSRDGNGRTPATAAGGAPR